MDEFSDKQVSRIPYQINEINRDKLEVDILIEKIDQSTYGNRKAIIKKLKDAKRQDFTKQEAFQALKYSILLHHKDIN